MRRACGLPTPVPSFSLLRFLRRQAEGSFSICPSNKAATCRDATSRSSPSCSYRDGNNTCLLSSARHFTTCQYREANVELSRLAANIAKRAPSNQLNCTLSFSSISRHKTPASQFILPEKKISRHAFHGFQNIWCRLRGSSKHNGGPNLKSKNPPPIASFLEDTSGPLLGRSKLGKAANDLKLRCTELNKHGRVTTVNGEFKKSELIAKVCLEPRYL